MDELRILEEGEELWELEEVDVPRVDLVRSPANRRKFVLFKSEEVNMEQKKDFEEVVPMKEDELQNANAEANVSTTAETPISIEAQNATLTDEDRDVLRKVLELLQPLKEKLNPVLLETLVVAAGYPKTGRYPTISPYPYPHGYPMPMKDIEKALENLPDEARERILKALEEAEKREKELIEKERKALYDRLEALQKANEELRQKLEEQERLRREKEAIEKAAREFRNLPVKAEALGPILLKLESALTEDERKELFRVLKAADEVMAKAEFFKEIGSAVSESTIDDPQAKLERKAKELADKEGIPLQVAKAEVLKRDKELYRALKNRG